MNLTITLIPLAQKNSLTKTQWEALTYWRVFWSVLLYGRVLQAIVQHINDKYMVYWTALEFY